MLSLVAVMGLALVLSVLVIGFVAVAHSGHSVPVPAKFADAVDKVTDSVRSAAVGDAPPSRRTTVSPLGQHVRRLRRSLQTHRPAREVRTPVEIDLRDRLRVVEPSEPATRPAGPPMARHGADRRT